MERLAELFKRLVTLVKQAIKVIVDFVETLKPWAVVEVTHEGGIILSRHWTRADAVISAPPREHIIFARVAVIEAANRAWGNKEQTR